MRRKSRPLKPEEKDLWRRYTKGINPLRQDVLKESAAPKAGPAHDKPRAAPQGYVPPPPLRHAPPTDQMNLDAATQRKLRRGRAEIDARIDLHGMRQAEAHAALTSFILRSKDRGHRCVLVITGKGTRGVGHNNPYETPGPGVLRTRLRQWLAQDPVRAHVFGVEEAHPRHGGAGAFYVFIRRK
jgi:DNA-nicking Smr family endonuclease